MSMSQSQGAERRRHVRVRLRISARLEVPPSAALPCNVYNMSVGGALVETRAGMRLGQPIVLHVQNFGAVAGHVARVTSTVVALVFDGVDEDALAQFIAHQSPGAGGNEPPASAAAGA